MAVRLVRRAGWREEGGQPLTTPSISLIHWERGGLKHRFTGCPIASYLLEVSLVEGADCHVVLQSHVGGLQLECTLKAVLCQLPTTQKHIHHSSVGGNENRNAAIILIQ